MLLRSWRLSSDYEESLESEDLIRLGRPLDLKDLEEPRLHVRFVIFCSCLYQSLIVQFVFFWPHVETNKELQGQKEWTNNSWFWKGISNV